MCSSDLSVVFAVGEIQIAEINQTLRFLATDQYGPRCIERCSSGQFQATGILQPTRRWRDNHETFGRFRTRVCDCRRDGTPATEHKSAGCARAHVDLGGLLVFDWSRGRLVRGDKRADQSQENCKAGPATDRLLRPYTKYNIRLWHVWTAF